MRYLNGKIIPQQEAKIDTQDRGFLVGDGLFETIACHGGRIFNLEAHWKRLQKGLQVLNFSVSLSFSDVQEILKTLLLKNQIIDGLARITLTRGAGERGVDYLSVEPTVLITTASYKAESRPLALCISSIKVNALSPLCAIKSTNYLEKILAKQEAKNKNFHDALLLNTQEKIVSATSANIFFVKNQQLYTPRLEDGSLPGTTRELILEIARKENISVKITSLEKDFFLSANDAFITNCLIGVQRISQIENKNYSNQLSALFKNAYKKLFV